MALREGVTAALPLVLESSTASKLTNFSVSEEYIENIYKTTLDMTDFSVLEEYIYIHVENKWDIITLLGDGPRQALQAFDNPLHRFTIFGLNSVLICTFLPYLYMY